TARLARVIPPNRFLYQVPVPVFIPNLTTAKLHALDRNGDLPSVTPNHRDLLNALSRVQVLVGRDLHLGSPTSPAAVFLAASGTGLQRDPTGNCISATAESDQPTLRFSLRGPVTVALTSNHSGTLKLELDQALDRSDPRTFQLKDGRTFLN